ncbi:hypothetical protein [Butyrivibrio sp. XPD2006]|uniref:hypothetical protein n=1 Tax=Butyrivibrio sp. XPD2006 TaxID=1280668 RepID=UPI0004189120|nr:hypothetical protein [Butyrivibrio sp. XPD2006]
MLNKKVRKLWRKVFATSVATILIATTSIGYSVVSFADAENDGGILFEEFEEEEPEELQEPESETEVDEENDEEVKEPVEEPVEEAEEVAETVDTEETGNYRGNHGSYRCSRVCYEYKPAEGGRIHGSKLWGIELLSQRICE